MNENLSMNDRLRVAGIKTIRSDDGVFLSRNGVTTRRPHFEACVEVCLSVFNVAI